MKYWDSSALVPLFVEETSSARMIRIYRSDPAVVTWWGSEIECVSALARLEREGTMTTAMVSAAMDRLAALRAAWHEVQPSRAVRDTAVRLLRMHPLRAPDAIQLSSAIIVADRETAALDFVSLDTRLASAAQREGFPLIETG